MNKKDTPLDGHRNGRLTTSRPTINEGTAAWTNEETKQKNTDVTIPKIEGVIEAKKWVDNGSRL